MVRAADSFIQGLTPSKVSRDGARTASLGRAFHSRTVREINHLVVVRAAGNAVVLVPLGI